MFDEWLRISRTTDCIRSAKLSKRYMNSLHVRNKMPTTNGYRWPEKTNHFFKSSNLLSIGVPHKFHLFVSYDCYSYHRIELTSCAQCKILTSRDSRNEIKMGYTKNKKSSLVSGNWLGGNFFFTYTPNQTKQMKLKKKRECPRKID